MKCGECIYCQPHPQAPAGAPVGMCFASPPVTLLLPMQQTPREELLNMGGAKNRPVNMALQSVRPAVGHDDRSCAWFIPTEAAKH